MNGYRLKQAREILRLTQTALAEKLGVSQATVAKIEQGLIGPSESLFDRIVLQTGFPKSHFLKPAALEFPEGSLLYRKQTKLSATDRGHIRNVALIAYEVFMALKTRVSFPSSTLPVVEDEPVETTAELARSALGFAPTSPITSLVRRLENSGVICLAVPCHDIEGFDGFSLRIDRRPIIVVDSSKAPDRIRLTVAHELDHLLSNHKIHGTIAETERVANRFAGEFLMPAAAMEEELQTPVTLSHLADLKMRWGVSMAALVRRAKDMGAINADQYTHLNIKLRKAGWYKQEPGSDRLPSERPRALRKMAEVFYGKQLEQLARDCNVPADRLRAIIAAHDPGRNGQASPSAPREKAEILTGPFRVKD